MGEQADTVVVATGSAALDAAAVDAVPPGAVIIAADGGLDHAMAAGLRPDVLVGDLDSVSADRLAWAEAHIDVVRHPAEKALTDTELAIEQALARQPRQLMLIAGAGDRLDHAIAAIGALGTPALGRVATIEAWWGADQLLISRPRRSVTFDRPAGTTFSVLAMHGPCRGVTITGARWPLTGADLEPLTGVGVSNVVLDPPITVDVATGIATVIIPGAQP